MAIFITGHDRSGTTFLQRVCNTHPQIMVTNEFNLYIPLGLTYPAYASHILRHLLRIKNRYKFNQQYRILGKGKFSNFPFTLSYLVHLWQTQQGPIGVIDIERTLKKMNPEARVVGDKKTIYNSRLETMIENEALKGIVIYRDCRDVASSFLIMTRTSWRKQAWAQRFNTAAAVAQRWVDWMGLMEQYANQLFILRYESLVCDPASELAALAAWLGVPADGFQYSRVTASSIGKYRENLSGEELSQLLEIAGPTMARYGYI